MDNTIPLYMVPTDLDALSAFIQTTQPESPSGFLAADYLKQMSKEISYRRDELQHLQSQFDLLRPTVNLLSPGRLMAVARRDGQAF